MKQQYKIIKNPKPLSPEQMDKHKDFGALLNEYQQVHHYKTATKPLYKNVKLLSLMVVIGVLMLVIWVDQNEKKSNQAPTPATNSINVDSNNSSKPTTPIDSGVKSNSEPTILNNSSTLEKQSSSTSNIAADKWDHQWDWMPSNSFLAETKSGIRILLPSNSAIDKAGNATVVPLEVLFRNTNENRNEFQQQDTLNNQVQFEIRIREKKTKAWIELSSSAMIEVPLAVSVDPNVWHWNTLRKKWESEAYIPKIRFTILSEISDYKILTHHVWEYSFKKVSEIATWKSPFGKEWRSLEWKGASQNLTSDKKAFVASFKPARLYANPDAQKNFEDKIYACWQQKKIDTCSGNTISQWKQARSMWKSSTVSICITPAQTGIFCFSYKANTSGIAERQLVLKPYPVNTRLDPPDNYNP